MGWLLFIYVSWFRECRPVGSGVMNLPVQCLGISSSVMRSDEGGSNLHTLEVP
jgi:hypothetical protein